MGRVALVAALVLLTAASVAFAAPPWSTPETVSSSSLFVDSPRVAFDRGGRAYATWNWTNGTGPTATGGLRYATRDPGALEFGPERTAPKFATPLLAYGANRVIGLDQRARGRRLVSLRARLSRLDGSFGRPDSIATYEPGAGPPSLAVPDVDPSVAVHAVALAAWSQQAGRRQIVRAAIRRPGHRFARPVTLRGRGHARHVVASVGTGVMIVAWERDGVVEARVRLSGRGWGPVRRIARTARGSTTLRAVVTGRRGYLAWLSEGEDDRSAGAVLQATVLPAARTRFRTPQIVDTINRARPIEPHGPVLVPVATGDRAALLAWTGWDGTAWRVRAAVTGPDARFGATVDASPPGEQAVLGDAEAAPPGVVGLADTVMVVWSRLDAVGEVGDRVRAALRTPAGSFGEPEDVSDLDRARLPDVAFDSVGKRWTAVWSQRIGADQGVPLSQITTFARSSTRPG